MTLIHLEDIKPNVGGEDSRIPIYQILVDCLVRHLWKQREAILERVERKGWNWDETKQEHQELEMIDKALTRLGFFDG